MKANKKQQIIQSESKQPNHTTPLLEELLLTRPRAHETVTEHPLSNQTLIGECIHDWHPVLLGRILVRWVDKGQSYESWLPTLQNLSVRILDRVLITRAANFSEPIITGILDGFARRPDIPRESAAALELKRDETIKVVGSNGQEILEIYDHTEGPVVRLLSRDTHVELAGKLRVDAQSIEFRAKEGPMKLTATEDVEIKGEIIRLN